MVNMKAKLEVAREIQDDIICLEQENKELQEELNSKDPRDLNYINGRIELNERLILQQRRELREMMEDFNFSIENDYDDTGLQSMKIGKRYGDGNNLVDIEIMEPNVDTGVKTAKFAMNSHDALNIINYLSIVFEIRQYQKKEF